MSTNITTPFDPLLDKVLIEDSVTGETQARPFPEMMATAPVSAATQTALDLKEDKTNKAIDLTAPNDIKYPTTKAVSDALIANRQSADGVSIKGTGFSPNPFEINYPTQAQVLAGVDASKAINSALLKAKTDTTLPKDIASGAVIGTNLVLTLQDGTALPNIDVTSLANVPDVKLQSGVYNVGTKALDFTLSNATVISVPVSALLPVNTNKSIQGDGAITPLELVNDQATPGNNKVYGTNSTGVKGYVNESKSSVNTTFGTITDVNPDGTTTDAVANWGNLTNYSNPIVADSLYITDTVNNKNHVIRIDDLKAALSPKLSGVDLTGTQNEVITLSDVLGNKKLAIEKKDIIIDVDGPLDFTKGLNVNYSITQTVSSINLPLTSNYQTLITDPNFANDRTGELTFTNLTGNTVVLRTQAPDEIGISGNSKYFLERGESAILGIVFNQLGTFGSNSSGYKVLADKKNATASAPLSNIAYTSQATATVLQTDASTINVQIPIDILNTATPVGTDKIAFVNSSGIHRKVDLTNLPMTTAQNTINVAQTATNTAQTATNTSQASINTTQATTNSTQATINTTQTATNTAQATTNANTITALNLKQDKTSFAVPSLVLGSTTVSQKILITDQASTATNSIDVDSLFSVFPTKDTLGKIILPVVTNNDFFRSGSGTTLPDGTTDISENISRTGRIGINVSDPSQVISTVDNFGSQGFAITEVSAAAYTATDTNYTIILNAPTLQTVTLMTPASAARREYVIVNNGAVSKQLTQSYTRFDGVTTTTIPASSSITIQSNGSLWKQIQGESTNGLKSKRITQPLIVGNNVITHNMALVAPFFVELTVRNAATGAVITVRKVPATEGSNTVTVNTGTAIASAEINIIQINA